MNSVFQVKLTPEHDERDYTQNLPTPTILKDDLLVELALMLEYGIIHTLPHSKYSSPIFANDNHPTNRLTDVNEPIQLTRFCCKVSFSNPVMSQVSPVEGIDLIEKQTSNWVITKND